MKNLKFFALLSMFVFGTLVTFAQEVAHVDYNKVLDAMPEYKKANSDFEALANKHKTEIEKFEGQLRTLYEQAQKELQGKSPEEAQKILTDKKYQEQEQTLQQKIQTYREAAQKEMIDKEKSLFEPVYQKANKAIAAAAKKKNIKYVLQESAVIYFGGGYDMFNDVKAELGIK
ncbi:OmpH family outer membrane protein [Vaginella massiliensis]|uniref:OmpH family outer membrane protein n=1 Tax=Vaginella massiliensis TaxID=1816680 RepID=UPI001F330F67|nr:OmpH family outer membrane protein [Vaginella massiliensis]